MKNFQCVLFFSITTLLSCAQQVESEIKAVAKIDIEYTTELVVPELNIPWGMTFLPDGSLLITEKTGEIIHYRNGQKISLENVPEVYVRGQGGLLDIKAHPDYENNGWIYITFSSSKGSGKGGNTALMRFKLNDNKLIEKELLYKAEGNTKKGQHWGSRIVFDKEGFLYFSIGDRGNRDVNPQDITKDCGKIYRLHDDGTIPNDNPFINEEHAKTAIYSYGHRNPQGLTLNPSTGAIWNHEHGPKGGDEINIIKGGTNYGWPIISYGINYDGTAFTQITEKEGMEQPVFFWVPSIAPSGMTFVSSEVYPNWKGDILVGSLKFEYLERLILENEKVIKREKLFEDIGRVRHVIQGPDEYLYLAVEGKGIYKIISKN